MTANEIRISAAKALGWPEADVVSVSLRSLREILRGHGTSDATYLAGKISRIEDTGGVIVGRAYDEILAEIQIEPNENARLEIIAGQHGRLVEETARIPAYVRLKLAAAGWKPVVAWTRLGNLRETASTGSALTTIAIEERQATCAASSGGHERGAGSEVDWCRHCGFSMPSMLPRR